MNWKIALNIITWLVGHRDEIRNLILSIENLVGDIKGSDKAQIVKDYIASALAIEDKIEQAWPLVSKVFNAFVALTKGKVVSADQTQAAPAP